MKQLNTLGIEQVAATVCGLLGIPSHGGAAQPIGAVLSAADAAPDGRRADRVFLYNPRRQGLSRLRRPERYARPAFLSLYRRAMTDAAFPLGQPVAI